jgi:hypothetical protein
MWFFWYILGPWAKANYCRAVTKSPRGTPSRFDTFLFRMLTLCASTLCSNTIVDTMKKSSLTIPLKVCLSFRQHPGDDPGERVPVGALQEAAAGGGTGRPRLPRLLPQVPLRSWDIQPHARMAHAQATNFIFLMGHGNETLKKKSLFPQSTYFTVRWQSYFSRLPKYWPPTPLSALASVYPPAFVTGGGQSLNF